MAHDQELATHPSAAPEDMNPGGQEEAARNSSNTNSSRSSSEGDEGEIEDTDPPLPDEDAPPLPNEETPPLPSEAPPGKEQDDDGWAPVWDDNAQAFYFYNRFTGLSQWENPRVPEVTAATVPGAEETAKVSRPAGGYDPAIHGDYDPNADYAKAFENPISGLTPAEQNADPSQMYAATGAFNRFTGKWQAASITPENYNDDAKSKRQMNAFFDVDAAANAHDGRSLRAERANKKLSRQEIKAFREKRREKKEEKRRAWLRD